MLDSFFLLTNTCLLYLQKIDSWKAATIFYYTNKAF